MPRLWTNDSQADTMVAMEEDNRETGITNLDEKTWIEYYGLVNNPYTGFTLFENEGKPLDLVIDSIPVNRVWSWLPPEDEDEPELIRNGFYPDALAYYITEAPYNPKEETIIPLRNEID